MSHTAAKLRTIFASIAVVALACHVSPRAFAQKPGIQSVAEPEEDNSVEAEIASFELAPGYEVNLFADENDGIANPVCMSWDPAGRLWVLVSSAYPQLEQAASPDDQLLILEDSDQDGRADKTTVFARGLNMPTGFALGHGGAYVGMGTDLIHLSDVDGDDRADKKRLVFTGFGTGDTHQNINSFTWSPGGEMLFCQGVHSFSRIETPWGISRLDQHGSWRMRPLRRQLHGYQRTGAGGNPWGILFGNWGEAFIKSNGPPIAELIPSMVSSDLPSIRQGFEMVIGRTQPKSMIMEIPESPHLPDDIRGDLLTAGYFGHVIHRMKVERDGAGHRLKNQPPLLRATHRAFRPVDLRVGPDGALYVADWFNPIIGHYQASLRHPDRDKTHGRIWRVTATGRPLAAAPDFSRMDVAELCDQLKSNWRYVRYQAKRRLADLPADEVIPAIRKWVDGLGSDDTNPERHLYEAIGVFESHEVVNRPLLERLLASREAGARAYAARVVGRWSDRIEEPLELLDRRVNDEDSRVRMEAIVACSEIRSAESMVVAAKVLDHSRDRFIDYSLTSTAKALASRWLPALQKGTITFADPEHLVFVLEAHGGKNVAGQVRSLVQSQAISKEARRQLLQLLARVGDSNDLLTVFQHSRQDPPLLQSLPVIASHRRLVPSGSVHNELAALLKSEDPATRAAAARLSGLWNVRELTALLEPMIGANENALVRAAAIRSLAELDPAAAPKRFTPLIDVTRGSPVYLAALESVARHDIKTAAAAGLKLLAELDSAESFGPVLSVIMNRRGGAEAMAVALGPASISADDAKLVSRWLSAAGHDDAALVGALKSRMGIKPGRETPYDISLVRSLAEEIRKSGDAAAGKRVFTSSLANCTACHRVQNVTTKVDAFPKGPDLSAVAAGLQLELIIESVIWPKRLIKEGFEMTTILTDDGRAFSGYVASEDDSIVGLRDLATGKVRRIPVETIEDRIGKGTAMPSGFTNSLTREELRDLIAYMATLKGAPTKNETGGAPIPGSGKGTNHGGPQAAEKPAGSAATKQKPWSMHERPNVLFIAIDDLRTELGCYGVDYIQSPRIDAFAKSARLFNNHYVTAPTCGASRYALLTGLSPRSNHEAGNLAFKQNVQFTAQREIESFPHLFKEAGYETISIGKICHGKQDTLPRSWTRILRPEINHPDFQRNSGKTQRPAAQGLDLPDAAYQDGAMTDTVIKTLRTLKDRPFFFAVGYIKPHLPFWAPQKYFDLYDPKTIPQPDWSVAPESPSYHGSFELMQQYGHHPEDGLEDPEYRRKLKHGYAACVSFVDAQIGHILDEVEALGLDENTIIVLWGDHGWHLGEHHLFGKHTSFEGALKSPLIIRTPSMKNKGRSTSALVQSIDIYPTLAGLCGLTPPADIDGTSFIDVLDDPDLAGPEYALSYNMSYGPSFKKLGRLHAVTMRTREYRYIQWQKDLGRGEIIFQELYDHRTDPEEQNNLAESSLEIVERLSKQLAKHQDNKKAVK